MNEEIDHLKDGVLLVRLQTKENGITALRKMGNNEFADIIMEKQLQQNKEIISAFKNNFTFCPAYFFLSNYSDSVLSKQINGIVFLDDNLQPDTTVKLNNRKFLTAEFGIIEQDPAKYFSGYYYYQGENGLERRSAYDGGPDLRFGALKIMNDKLVQLKRPFPYYVRTFNSTPFKRKFSKVVRKMNKNLFSYYYSFISQLAEPQ
ncbi:MAG: hypothetical protein ACHQNT_12200 [Bacteroidia bacterium]